MSSARDYVKIVKWSYEDNAYVGMVPSLFSGGCHGPDEKAVFDELCQIVSEWEEIYEKHGDPWPPADPPHISEVADRFRDAMRRGNSTATAAE
jgi:predicted RNase H-like HicB family nuclease